MNLKVCLIKEAWSGDLPDDSDSFELGQKTLNQFRDLQLKILKLINEELNDPKMSSLNDLMEGVPEFEDFADGQITIGTFMTIVEQKIDNLLKMTDNSFYNV